MTLKTRLILSLSLLSGIILGLLAGGFLTLQEMSNQTTNLVEARIAPMRDLKIMVDAYAVAIVDNVHKTRAGTVDWGTSLEVMRKAEADIANAWAQNLLTNRSAEEQPIAARIAGSMAAAEGPLADLAKIIEMQDRPALIEFAEQRLYPAIDPISGAVSEYVAVLEAEAGAELAAQQAFQNAVQLAMIAAAILSIAAIGYGAYVIVQSVASRLRVMEVALGRVADGDLSVAIPYTDRKDEIGHMAAAAEVFRMNGVKLAAMIEADEAGRKSQEAKRRAMMAELQSAFGDVVAAAGGGDLSPRVEARFADPELNNLATDVNTLLDSVESGVTATANVLAALARAELHQRVEGTHLGAFGRLQSDTNAVADRLTEIVGDLRSTSGSLRIATTEILAGANDLSERTTRQAATIEETSAAMEQLAATVTQNAKGAENAAVQAANAASGAADSGDAMQRATEAMHNITQSSAKIASIIGVIDDIAFQTNLLALNASVEAARAGESGKGFAVVAQEVRRLAQSAAESSSDVKALIQQSSLEINAGAALVTKASGAIAAVLATVRENALSMNAIADASRAQAGAIAEVTGAVRQMDEMTQHNAALVEQTNAAIEQTEAQAATLDKLIDVFKLETPGSRTGPRPQLAWDSDRAQPRKRSEITFVGRSR